MYYSNHDHKTCKLNSIKSILASKILLDFRPVAKCQQIKQRYPATYLNFDFRFCYSDDPLFWGEWKAELEAIGRLMIQVKIINMGSGHVYLPCLLICGMHSVFFYCFCNKINIK